MYKRQEQNSTLKVDYRVSFETFKSNTCHQVKDKGDLDFIIETLETNRIRELYGKKWYAESLYLLGMVDYLSRVNDLPVCTNYNDIRSKKLEQEVYPSSVPVSYTHLDVYKRQIYDSEDATDSYKAGIIISYDSRGIPSIRSSWGMDLTDSDVMSYLAHASIYRLMQDNGMDEDEIVEEAEYIITDGNAVFTSCLLYTSRCV